MSNLLVTYDGLVAPAQTCAEDPDTLAADAMAAAKSDPKRKGTSAPFEDPCNIILPLAADDHLADKPHNLRFDRQKDHFVLSKNNSSEDLTWIGKQSGLSDVLDMLRLREAVMRAQRAAGSVDSHKVILMIAQYIVTGRVVLPDTDAAQPKVNPSTPDIANPLLEVFTISSDDGIGAVLGALTMFRADKQTSEAAKERIRQISDIVDLRPRYQKLRRHFIADKEVEKWIDGKDPDRKDAFRKFLYYMRKVIVAEWLKLPVRYDADMLQSFLAYQTLHSEIKSADAGSSYCDALEKGLTELRGTRGGGKPFVEECRAALNYAGLPSSGAIRMSLKDGIVGATGLPLLSSAIAEESVAMNMSADWLSGRKRFVELYESLDRHLQVNLPKKAGDAPSLSMDALAMKLDLNALIDAQYTNRREYVLAALALMRRMFGEQGTPPNQRVFSDGGFIDIPWQLSKEDLSTVRNYIMELERGLAISKKRSDLWLPLVEASTCVLGGVGLAVSEGYSGVRDRNDLHLGFGATSAGLAGAGCSSLAGHYLWPKVTKVRNRYLWDGLTGVGGAVLGLGIYFLVNSLRGNPGSPVKFPTDGYGP